MSAGDDKPAGFTLRRWSQRKLAAAREPTPARPAAAAPTAAAIGEPAAPSSPLAVTPTAPAASSPADPAASVASDTLPPVESLGFDSDFSAFMQPKVEESLKRQALKRLFQDPRFNVMDGLDTYIDDYSIPDPIPPEMLAQLTHTRYLFDPPKTRVNAEGYVEDVPPEEAEAPPAPGADVAPVALPDADVAHAAPPNAALPDAAAQSPPAAATAPAQPDAGSAPIARPDDQGSPAR